MRIRTVFLTSVVLGSIAGSFGLVLYNLDQWSGFGASQTVLAQTRLLTTILQLPENLNIERAFINAQLVGANVATGRQRELVMTQIRRVDESLRQARLLAPLVIRAELDIIDHQLQSTRSNAVAKMEQPLRERDGDAKYRQTMFDLQEAAYRIAVDVQRHITALDPASGAATRLALLAWQFRDWSGRQTTTLISYVGLHLPIEGDQAETLAVYKGHLDQIWSDIEELAANLNRPEINAAVQNARRGFWEGGGEAFKRWVIPNRGAVVTFDIDNFVGEIRKILDTSLPIRDAAMAEARRVDEARVMADERHAAMSAVLAVLTICVGGAAFWWFDRRVLRATAELTTTINRLAKGERAVSVPMQDRTDEIGQMSRAIEVLRTNAIAAEAEQRQRADEEARLSVELAVQNDSLARLNHELEISASTDALTGLANRKAFGSRLRDMIAEAARGRSYALHCVDLDLFKQVNDTFGHPVGDALLQAVAGRLRHCVRTMDFVARLGGDEFAILQFAADESHAAELACRVTEAIRQPYDLHGNRCVISATIGIMVDHDGQSSAATIFRNADMALYDAKSFGRGSARAYHPDLLVAQQAAWVTDPGDHSRTALPAFETQL